MTGDGFVWPVRDQAKGAWFGSAELKAWVMARMLVHRAEDEIVRGIYQDFAESASGYQGCLIGCTLPRDTLTRAPGARVPEAFGYVLPSGEFVPGDASREQDVENLYGIRYEVGDLMELAFESCPGFEDAADFAVASIEAIPVGAVYPPPSWWAEDRDGPIRVEYPDHHDRDDILAFLRSGGTVPA